MFFIKLTIAFREQLLKAGETELRAMLASTSDSFLRAGASREEGEGYFSFSDDSPGMILQIALCSWKAAQALDGASDKLFGYAITIERHESGAECHALIEERERRLPHAEGLFIGRKASRYFEPYLDLELDGSVFKVKGLKVGGDGVEAAFDSYFEQSMADRIFPALERMAKGEAPPILALSCPAGIDFGAALGGMLNSMGLRHERVRVEEGSPGPRPFLRLLEGSGNLGANYVAKSAFRSRFPVYVLSRLAEGLNAKAQVGDPFIVVIEDADRLDASGLDFVWSLVTRDEGPTVLAVLCGKSLSERVIGHDGLELIQLEVSRSGLTLFAERTFGKELPETIRAMLGSSVTLNLDELALVEINLQRVGAKSMAEILNAMGSDLKAILYLHLISFPMLNEDERRQFIEGFGILPSTFELALGEAKAAGLLAKGSLVPRNGLTRAIEEEGDVDCAAHRRSLLSYVRALSEKGRLSVSMEFLRNYKRSGLASDERFALDCLFHDLSEGSFSAPESGDSLEGFDELYDPLKGLYDPYFEMGLPEHAKLQDRGLAYACECYARAAYLYSKEVAIEAMPLAKAALMRFQEMGYKRGEAKANRLVGLLSLAQDRIIMASEYFEIAYELAMACGSEFDAMLALASDATAAFIDGNASKASRHFKRAASIAETLIRPDFEGAYRFSRARCLIELCRFDEAEREMHISSSLAKRYGIEKLGELDELWAAKLAIDRGLASRTLESLKGRVEVADACLFAAEAYFALGEPEACGEAAERAITLGKQRHLAPVEGLSLDSGFSSMEDASIGYGKGERASTQRAKALLGWSLVVMGKHERGLELLYEVTRGNPLSEHGPHAPFLHRLRQLAYESLGDGYRGEAEKALGKAFRALQQRASRNDEIEARNSYLESHFSMEIIEDARSLKLF